MVSRMRSGIWLTRAVHMAIWVRNALSGKWAVGAHAEPVVAARALTAADNPYQGLRAFADVVRIRSLHRAEAPAATEG